MTHFILVVDGEVAGQFPVPKVNFQSDAIDKLVAILSSDPKIVLSEEPVLEGSTWDGQEFTPPVE
jgi:hypothetical protein